MQKEFYWNPDEVHTQEITTVEKKNEKNVIKLLKLLKIIIIIIKNCRGKA